MKKTIIANSIATLIIFIATWFFLMMLALLTCYSHWWFGGFKTKFELPFYCSVDFGNGYEKIIR